MSEEVNVVWILITMAFAFGLALTVGSLISIIAPALLSFAWGIGFITVASVCLLSAYKYYSVNRE